MTSPSESTGRQYPYEAPARCPKCSSPRRDPQPKVMSGFLQEMHITYECGAQQIASREINACSTWTWSAIESDSCKYIRMLRDDLREIVAHWECETAPLPGRWTAIMTEAYA